MNYMNYWNLDFPNFQGKQKFVRKIECIQKLEIGIGIGITL